MAGTITEEYKGWNIKGIAESVLAEIRADGNDPDDVLDDYLHRAYLTVFSREPKDAKIVMELVRSYIASMNPYVEAGDAI